MYMWLRGLKKTTAKWGKILCPTKKINLIAKINYIKSRVNINTNKYIEFIVIEDNIIIATIAKH